MKISPGLFIEWWKYGKKKKTNINVFSTSAFSYKLIFAQFKCSHLQSVLLLKPEHTIRFSMVPLVSFFFCFKAKIFCQRILNFFKAVNEHFGASEVKQSKQQSTITLKETKKKNFKKQDTSLTRISHLFKRLRACLLVI